MKNELTGIKNRIKILEEKIESLEKELQFNKEQNAKNLREIESEMKCRFEFHDYKR